MVTRRAGVGGVTLFLALNEMNGQQPKLLPTGVTLSRSEESIWMGVEMLRCAQHDSAVYKYFCLDS